MGPGAPRARPPIASNRKGGEDARPPIVYSAAMPQSSRSLSPLLIVPLLLTGACMSTEPDRTPRDRVLSLIGHGEFAEAVELAAQFTEEDPVSQEFEDLHRYASVAYLLEKGRRATFEELDRLAIQRFQEALALDPEHGAAQRWLFKTQTKLASRLTDEGMELAANAEFQEAWRRYTEAIEVLPDFQLALDSMERLDSELAYRETKAGDYYDQGVAAMIEAEYNIAANRFGYVRKYRDEDDRLRRRSKKVDKAIGQERVDWATKLEQEGLFYAARAEFQAALLDDPDNAAAREGVLRSGREAEVSELLSRGQGALTRGEFIKAQIFFEDALEMTIQQKEAAQGMLDELALARRQAQFEVAVSLENDFRLEAAIQSYDDLLVQYPDFEEARVRQADLRTRVQKALQLYGSLSSDKSDEERLTILLQVEELFPDFRDVPERIERLEAAGVQPIRPEGEVGETVE